MTKSRLALIGAGVLVVVFAAGWLWGASGRSAAENALETAELQLDLSSARADLLAARVALYNVNFGDASRRIEEARPALTRARDALNAAGRTAHAGFVDAALRAVEEAQRMAGALDQGANTRLAEAIDALAEIPAPAPAPAIE